MKISSQLEMIGSQDDAIPTQKLDWWDRFPVLWNWEPDHLVLELDRTDRSGSQ